MQKISIKEIKRFSKINRKDIDNLVVFAEGNPELRGILHDLDMLARKQNVELKDIVKDAIEWYYSRKHLS